MRIKINFVFSLRGLYSHLRVNTQVFEIFSHKKWAKLKTYYSIHFVF